MEECRHVITDDQKARIVELYASGESTLKIGLLLQLSPTTVNKWLHRFGVTLREPRETSTRCQVRHDAFDVITSDAAYWIGFLFADGSVRSDGQSGMVSVRVSERDRDQLAKFRTFLGSTHKIGTAPAGNFGGYRSKPSVRLCIPSVRLSQQLLSLGRYEGPISDLLIQSRDFWRGVVDGDGSLGILATGYAYFELVGSRRLLEACLSFLRSNELGARMTIRANKTIFQIATAGFIAEKIVAFLYENAAVALDRKAATAAKIAAMREVRLSAERARLTQIADWYQDGESLKQIGLRLGVSDVTVLHWMEKAGIPRRERHGGRRRVALS
jgi:transposase-like protein